MLCFPRRNLPPPVPPIPNLDDPGVIRRREEERLARRRRRGFDSTILTGGAVYRKCWLDIEEGRCVYGEPFAEYVKKEGFSEVYDNFVQLPMQVDRSPRHH